MNRIFFPARPPENHNYNIDDTLGIKLLNRLRLKFSYLKQSKFGNNFTDTINPFVNAISCFHETETTFHVFYAAETTPFTAKPL